MMHSELWAAYFKLELERDTLKAENAELRAELARIEWRMQDAREKLAAVKHGKDGIGDD